GLINATFTFPAPTASGAYNLKLFANGEYTLLATSPTVTVDNTPPAISAVAATSITSIGAIITWTTNEPSTSDLEYGLTTAYGSNGTANPSMVTAHTIALAGLRAGTSYHYRVRSTRPERWCAP